MTDLDKIKACARAMNMERVVERRERLFVLDSHGHEGGIYNPLANAAQADALEGWLLEMGTIEADRSFFCFFPLQAGIELFNLEADMTVAENRRRARVECVAKMMEGV